MIGKNIWGAGFTDIFSSYASKTKLVSFSLKYLALVPGWMEDLKDHVHNGRQGSAFKLEMKKTRIKAGTWIPVLRPVSDLQEIGPGLSRGLILIRRWYHISVRELRFGWAGEKSAWGGKRAGAGKIQRSISVSGGCWTVYGAPLTAHLINFMFNAIIASIQSRMSRW